jgi:hypothetical protein
LLMTIADCPLWKQFIREIVISAGWALIGDTSEQTLFILFGNGANGKSNVSESGAPAARGSVPTIRRQGACPRCPRPLPGVCPRCPAPLPRGLSPLSEAAAGGLSPLSVARGPVPVVRYPRRQGPVPAVRSRCLGVCPHYPPPGACPRCPVPPPPRGLSPLSAARGSVPACLVPSPPNEVACAQAACRLPPHPAGGRRRRSG